MPGPLIGPAAWQLTMGDYVQAVATSPDGQAVVAGSLAGDAVLAEATTGEILAKLADHPLGVLSVAWSPDGSTLAVGGQDGLVHLYGRDGERRADIELGGWVAALGWSPDGATLAAGSGRRLTLLDPDGTRRGRYDDVTSTITALAWSADGRRVGVTAYGGITWYEPAGLPDTAPARVHAWKGSLLCLELAPNGRWACAGAQDASVHLWRLWSGKDLSMSGYPAKIEQLAFRHDSRWMAAACLGEITVWDFGGKGPAGSRPVVADGHDRHIAALAWQPGGDRLASGGADGRVVLWPSPRGRANELRPLDTAEGDVGVAAFAWCGEDALMVGRADGTVERLPVQG